MLRWRTREQSCGTCLSGLRAGKQRFKSHGRPTTSPRSASRSRTRRSSRRAARSRECSEISHKSLRRLVHASPASTSTRRSRRAHSPRSASPSTSSASTSTRRATWRSTSASALNRAPTANSSSSAATPTRVVSKWQSPASLCSTHRSSYKTAFRSSRLCPISPTHPRCMQLKVTVSFV